MMQIYDRGTASQKTHKNIIYVVKHINTQNKNIIYDVI